MSCNMYSTLKTLVFALLVAQQALSKPVLQTRQLEIVDDLTCSLISKHLENPTSLVSHLLRRSPKPAGDLDTDALANILASCNEGGSSQRDRKLIDHSGDGGQDEGTIGNGQYPPFGNGATTSTVGSGDGAGTGSGDASNMDAGTGGSRSDAVSSNARPTSSSSNSDTSSGNVATTSTVTSDGAAGAGENGPYSVSSSNSRSSSGNNSGRLPFNPASAPYTVTRRAVAPPPASDPAEVVPSTSEAAQDEPTPQDFSVKNKSQYLDKQTKSGAKQNKQDKCVGQAGSITCPLQPLGL